MDTLKTIIIDDEQKGRNLLNELVKRYCPEVEVLGLAESATEAILKIRQLKPDFIFLYYSMPQKHSTNRKQINNPQRYRHFFIFPRRHFQDCPR